MFMGQFKHGKCSHFRSPVSFALDGSVLLPLLQDTDTDTDTDRLYYDSFIQGYSAIIYNNKKYALKKKKRKRCTSQN